MTINELTLGIERLARAGDTKNANKVKALLAEVLKAAGDNL